MPHRLLGECGDKRYKRYRKNQVCQAFCRAVSRNRLQKQHTAFAEATYRFFQDKVFKTQCLSRLFGYSHRKYND